MKYVISDIHGDFDRFIRMLNLINFKESETLYVLGDCIDRGRDGIKILQYIMRTPNIELLWGNHEKMMMDCIEDSSDEYRELNWMYNGGAQTYINFNLLPKDEETRLCDFIKSLPYYKIVDKFILCHAGVRVPDNSSQLEVEAILENQDTDDILWIKEEFYTKKAVYGYTVIFGHTPVVLIDECSIDKDGEFCAWHDKKYKDKIGIDCCAWFPSGRLCCLRLDDLQEFYV
jgi:serine/threonine protein phosphatase 1